MKKTKAKDDTVGQSRKEKLEINKQIKKLKREEQLKSGVKLVTKVVPDKSKYTRKKKTINPEEEP